MIICHMIWQRQVYYVNHFIYLQISTYWGWDKMAAILQTTVSTTFSSMKIHGLLRKFNWYLLLIVQLTVCQHCFRQIMTWRRSGDKPLAEPMMVWLQTHIYVTRPLWVKSYRQDLSPHNIHGKGNYHPYERHAQGSTVKPVYNDHFMGYFSAFWS